MPRDELEEARPQAVNVGPDVGIFRVGHLFGGHVIARADDLAVAGEAAFLLRLADEAGQADVEQFDLHAVVGGRGR